MISAKVGELLDSKLSQIPFRMPPVVQAGIDAAKALGLPIELPDINTLQQEARSQVLQKVSELEAQIPVEARPLLERIDWLK